MTPPVGARPASPSAQTRASSAPDRFALLARHRAADPVAFGEGGVRSAGDLIADAARLAERLPEATPGSHVELVFEHDRYAMAAALLAALDRGHAVALPPNTRPDSILALRERPEVVEIAHDIGVGLGLDARAVVAASASVSAPGGGTDVPRVDEDAGLARAWPADRLVATVFTSGSTGPMSAWPKTAAALLGEAADLGRTFALGAGDRLVATVPPGHIYGLLFGVLLPLVSGGAFLRETPRHATSILHATRRHAAKALVCVPVQLRALARSASLDLEAGTEPDDRPLGPVEHVFSSTGPLPATVARDFTRRFGVPITEILGSTETGGLAHRRRPDGTPQPWQPFDAVRVTTDADSRLLVEAGYLHPDLPRPFATGDLATLRDDGTFDHLGRVDGIVKVAGHRVSLHTLEEHLREAAGVEDAAVVGVPDDRGRGHRLLAAVSPADLDATALRRALLDRLEPTALPRRILCVDALPRETNGKLRRSELLRLFDLDAEGRPANHRLLWQDLDVDDANEATIVRRRVAIPVDYAWFEGHFVGYPVLAGAVQIKELLLPTVRQAFPDLGSVRALRRVKWNARIVPGDALTVRLERRKGAARLAFRILREDTVCTSGTIELGAASGGEAGG